MCGINGIISKSFIDEHAMRTSLSQMNDLIIHRGPDEDGVFTDSRDDYAVGMAMRRLSIIDLNTGRQPIFSDDQTVVIVFNGEIYNYKSLRKKLKDVGVSFKTQSDTEVILKLYELKGTESFKELDGMYSFSIYDSKSNRVYITRDFFGEKPLYYTQNKDNFIWASELKSVMPLLNYNPDISKEGLNLFFRLTYIPAPFTIYENIFKLEANSYIDYDLNSSKFEIKNIHEEQDRVSSKDTFQEATRQIRDRVYKSVDSRSVSDVPIGTFLSGGVDSSIVSFCLADMSDSKIDTFSIGFEKATYDESDKSKLVAKLINSNHHEFIINESDLEQNIASILLNFDEPFADSSALPTYLVSQKTKNHVKVALTGDGGDEVFGGYNKYYIGRLNSTYTKTVPRTVHHQIYKITSPLLKRKTDNRGWKYKLNKLINSISYDDSYYWDIISLGLSNTDVNAYLNPEYQSTKIFEYYKKKTAINSPKTLSEFRTIDRHISLEGDMLVKVDRTSMLNSLECRAPFLNKELYDYTMSLPEHYLIKKWSKKHILKEAFNPDFPDGFLERPKRGFGVPVGDWLRQGLRKELMKFIDESFLSKQGIFNISSTKELVENHLSSKKDNTFKVWTFYCFQKWYCFTFNNKRIKQIIK